MKGKTPDDEMAELPADLTVFHVEQLTLPACTPNVVWSGFGPEPL